MERIGHTEAGVLEEVQAKIGWVGFSDSVIKSVVTTRARQTFL